MSDATPAGDSKRLTSYLRDENGVALLRLERPDARNALNTQILAELLEHLAVARDDEAVRVLVFSSADPLGFCAGADVREQLDHDGHVRRMEMFSDLYDEVVAFPKPTVCRLPRRRRRRRGGDRCRLRPAGRRRQPAAALPRRRSGDAGRPRPPGHPLRPRRRQVPAADLEDDRRRRGAPPRPRQPGRTGRRDRGTGAEAGRQVAAHDPAGGRPPEGRCCTSGTTSSAAPPPRATARSPTSAPARTCPFRVDRAKL